MNSFDNQHVTVDINVTEPEDCVNNISAESCDSCYTVSSQSISNVLSEHNYYGKSCNIHKSHACSSILSDHNYINHDSVDVSSVSYSSKKDNNSFDVLSEQTENYNSC